MINLSGQNLVKLEIHYAVEHLMAGYSIGVAARNGNGAWNTLWSVVPLSSQTGVAKTLIINYPGFNTSNFQFCVFFQGNSQNISSLHLDHFRLYVPPAHDLAVVQFANPENLLANTAVVPKVLLQNNGQYAETLFPVSCMVYDGNDNLIYYNMMTVSQCGIGAMDTLSFPSLTLSFINEFFRFEAKVNLLADTIHNNDSLSRMMRTLSLVPRKYVLTEMGSATWCTQCPATSLAVNDMITAGKEVAVAEYHSPASDPFTCTASTERLDYYNISGFPVAYFDGLLSYAGSGNAYSEYTSRYNQRMNQYSPYDIKLYGTHTGNTYNLKVVLYRMAPVLNENLVLRVILTESHISYNWLGQSEIDHAVRMMIPDASGTLVDLVNHVQLQIPLTYTMNSGWVPENCEWIAFLQDTVTKEVMQVEKRTYAELVPYGFTKLQGYVRYDNMSHTPLGGVTVTLRLGGGVVASTTTSSNGYYSFTGVAPGTYYLSCSSAQSWGGGNAIDALFVMKHFVGLITLPALRLKAVDTDVSNYANATDAMNIMKRFVGYLSSFVRSDWVFESPTVTIPNSTIITKNIIGICAGDADGSYLP